MTPCAIAVLLLMLSQDVHSSVVKDTVLRFVDRETLAREKAEHKESKPLNYLDKAHYKDCLQLRHKGGYNVSGTYTLHINESFSYQIYCEHTANNSFTVIQRRMDGSVNFKRLFRDYFSGFGHTQGDYWAGLNQIYHLTSTGNNVLTVTMQTWTGATQTVKYHMFRILDTVNFTLSIGGYSGTIPDDLSFNNGMPFATYDRPDQYGCASNMHAGWWYNYCTYALPNGAYYYGPYNPSTGYYDGLYWKDWTGYNYSLKFFSMSLSNY